MTNLIALFIIQQLNFEQMCFDQPLIKTVENDLNNTNIEWRFNSLQAFPICFQCRTLLPSCLDLNAYGLNNLTFKKSDKDYLVGIRYKISEDVFCYSTLEYINENGQWKFLNEEQIVITQCGQIIKDNR